ncbi:hypothetical protein F1D05_11315 [Kribbella qitaiheensis]|uniref:Uncharacterized protein n=1 Tax=Kribbella qitaiheensis TaxID=1544730 RepID=A0A7G6WWL1_9ACTN|nr:hypothetical protein [Kribbella qitaiheensis]QNE18376.1 hypothetical protein F1D05_11315 [Kribbella qitaiheensis]
MSPTDEVDDLLTEAGARWRAGQPSPPEPDLDRIIVSKKPRRWVVPALAAASVAAIATAAIVFLPDRNDPSPSVAQGKESTAAGKGAIASTGARKHPLQVRNGDRVQVDGQVVAAPAKPAVYCIPVASDLPATVGAPPKPAACAPGAEVKLTGVDPDRLSGLPTVDGVKAGFAHLEGIWTDGQIAVDKQGPVVKLPDAGSTVPCAAPTGGWKPGDSSDLVTPAVEAFVSARPNQLQELSIGWPNGLPTDNGASTGPSVLMIGVAHGDVAQIRRLLTPLVKGNLCVTQVKLSKTEVDNLRNKLAAIPTSVLSPLSYGGGVGDHPVNIDLRVLDDKAVTALEPLGLDNLNIQPVIKPAP